MNAHILSAATRFAQEASKIILKALDRPRQVDHKGLSDLVTETDRSVEELIISQIKKKFPDHNILAEERGGSALSSDYLWVIDPLDGTTNFVHGYPCFAVSIGVVFKNQPQIGVVIELPANHIYTAVLGQGAYCNGIPITVSLTKELQKSLLVTGFGYNHDQAWIANMELFKHFTDITQGVRRLGAAAVDLCHVATGQVDGFWEFALHPWDSAAGFLIVLEAGGTVTKMDGKPYTIYDRQLLATNGKIHNDIIKKTQPVIEKLNDQGYDFYFHV